MLAEAAAAIPSRNAVVAALRQASAATGSDFDYLLDIAKRESGLKAQAKSSASSASGLFQFVDQTWLGLVKAHGSQFGLGSYASAITRAPDGHYHVDNHADRQAILALRNDPRVAALMEGEYANDARATLQNSLGRDVCDGELYAAHFLGPSAACKLIKLSGSQPSLSAAEAFPQAANANHGVFYHTNGTPKSVREVYDWALQQTGSARSSSDNYSASDLRSEDNQDLEMMAFRLSTGSGSSSSLGALAQMPFAMSVDLLDLLGSRGGALDVASRTSTR